MKNPYAKTVDKDNAYAVYEDKFNGWTWYVRKMYQHPDKAKDNAFARAYCTVTTPMAGREGDVGDVYLHDIGGTLIKGVDLRGERSATINVEFI